MSATMPSATTVPNPAGAPSRRWRAVRIVMIAALTILLWESGRAFMLGDLGGASYSVVLECANGTAQSPTLVLIDPNQHWVRSSGLGPNATVTVEFPLAGDPLPRRAEQVYTLMVIDEDGNQVWTRSVPFKLLWDVDGLRITETEGRMTVEPRIRPKAQGAAGSTGAGLKEGKP